MYEFNSWSGIHLNVGKYKIMACIQALQTIRKKRDIDDTLRARLANVSIGGRPVGTLTLDEPLPGGYVGTAVTASLSPIAHLH